MRSALLLALGLALSALPAEVKAQKDKAGETVVVTDKNAGDKVKIKVGDQVKVKLRFQGGTGFTWSVTRVDDKILEQVGKPTTEKIEGEKDRPGGPRLQVFTFTGKAAGETKLELGYARPFEKGKEPAKKFAVTVTVK